MHLRATPYKAEEYELDPSALARLVAEKNTNKRGAKKIFTEEKINLNKTTIGKSKVRDVFISLK